MNRLRAATLTLFLCGSAAAAMPTVDLHDPDAAFGAFKATQHDSYAAIDAQYRAAIALAPEDAELAVARCQFLEKFEYAEDISWTDTASADLDTCRKHLAKSLPQAPHALVYQFEHTFDDEAKDLAEKTWAAASDWPAELRARIAARLHTLYVRDNKEKAGEFAVIAVRLGNPDLVATAIKHLAGKGESKQAAELAARSAPATNGWEAAQRIRALGEMGDSAAARRELDRSSAGGLGISAALRVETYLADHDPKAANKAAAKLGVDKDSDAARFGLALANGQFASARDMVRFGDDFETWIARYSRLVAKAPLLAFSPPLLPATFVVLLCVFLTAFLPGFLLVPVHYRGLARRVRGRTPLPLFERIGLRHAWIAGAIILVVPALALLAMRPDAIGAIFTGGSESASTQFSVVAVGALLSLLALLPWISRLRMPQAGGQDAPGLRAAGAVLGCWLVIFAIGILSGLAHSLLVGGDSSTLQTRTVEELVRKSTSEYGLLTTWLLIAVLTPLVEELVFRGMLLGGMSRHISFGWANALQGLLFASIHADPPRFLVYLAIGLFCGWLTKRYRSLLPAIALHMLNNSAAILIHG